MNEVQDILPCLSACPATQEAMPRCTAPRHAMLHCLPTHLPTHPPIRPHHQQQLYLPFHFICLCLLVF